MTERSTFLADVQEILVGVLQAQKLADSKQAIEVSRIAVEQIRNVYSGEPVYIPKKTALSLEQRNAEIVAKHNGKNKRDIARAYNLAAGQIYKIIRNH